MRPFNHGKVAQIDGTMHSYWEFSYRSLILLYQNSPILRIPLLHCNDMTSHRKSTNDPQINHTQKTLEPLQPNRDQAKTKLSQRINHMRINREHHNGQDKRDKPKNRYDIAHNDNCRKIRWLLNCAFCAGDDKHADKVYQREHADRRGQPQRKVSEIHKGDHEEYK